MTSPYEAELSLAKSAALKSGEIHDHTLYPLIPRVISLKLKFVPYFSAGLGFVGSRDKDIFPLFLA